MTGDPEHAPTAPNYSDEDLALRLAARHADDARYVAAWNRWFIYQDGVWRDERTLKAFDLAREICREAAAEVGGKGKLAHDLASAKKVAAIVTLGRTDRRIAGTIDQWDRDPWRLNTPAGTVDLRTGKLVWSRPEYYHSKITAVASGGDCPAWRDFLDDATNNDRELQRYLQLAAGYMLTGSVREHVLFFIFGPGASGKSTFSSILTYIMGDYATVAPVDALMMSYADKHPTDLAALRGARLAVATETEEGRRWAEARIKMMTGGERITARYMRQDFFTYDPSFKLLVSGNHRPGLRSVDEAMRRRLRLIPFEHSIPEQDRDPDLVEKLKAEAGGILAWIIAGAVEWYANGLPAAKAVGDATKSYFEEEDALGHWLAECCVINQYGWDKIGVLYAAWRDWAERAGERPGSKKAFSQALLARDYVPVRDQTGRGFEGLRLDDYEPVQGNEGGDDVR